MVNQLGKDQGLIVGFNSTSGKVSFLATLLKSDSTKDVAVLSFTDYYQSSTVIDTTDFKFQQSAVGTSVFGDSIDTVEGAGVIIVGFPLGLGSEITGNRPISRIGIVAQSLSPAGTFIIDATTSHGNSGSPVFNLQSGKLIGMILGFPADRISAYDEYGSLIASLPYNSGLTFCISAREILKLIP